MSFDKVSAKKKFIFKIKKLKKLILSPNSSE